MIIDARLVRKGSLGRRDGCESAVKDGPLHGSSARPWPYSRDGDSVLVASTMIVPLVGLAANLLLALGSYGIAVRACGSRAGCRDGSPRP